MMVGCLFLEKANLKPHKNTHTQAIKLIPEEQLSQPVDVTTLFPKFWSIQRGQIFLTKRQQDLPSIVHHRAVVIDSFQFVRLDFVKVVLIPCYSEYKSIKTIFSHIKNTK